MKIVIDTNILMSATMSPAGRVADFPKQGCYLVFS